MVMALGSCEAFLMVFVSQHLSIGCRGAIKHTLYRVVVVVVNFIFYWGTHKVHGHLASFSIK
jgi:hypothetical protein